MPVGRIYTATTPFNDVELFDINDAPSNDLLYMAHWDHAPGKMQRYDHDDWRWADVTFGPDLSVPTGLAVDVVDDEHDGGDWNPKLHRYKVSAVSDATGQESLPSAYVEAAENDLSYPANHNDLSWDALAGAHHYVLYKALNGIYGFIGETTELVFTDDDIEPDLSIAPQEQRNPFSDVGDDIGNRPGEVFLFEQRLGWARTRNKPNGVWLSQSANFENMNFSRPATARDAITFAIVGRPGNFIQSMVPATNLVCLTVGSTYVIEPGSEGFLTPNNPRPHPGPSRGSSKVPHISIDDQIFHVQARGSKIRSLGFTFEVDGYRGDDLTVFARHLFKNRTLVDWCYTEEPNCCFWLVFADGDMVCLTFIREQMVVGYTVIETDGLVESVCAVPEEGEDKLYLIVRRTVDAVQRRYVERMATTEWDDKEEAIYLDASITYRGPGVEEITGLHHLEGRTDIAALVNGDVLLDLEVTDGRCRIYAAGKAPSTDIICHIGIPYVQLIETLPVSGQLPGLGSVQGRRQSVTNAAIRVIDTKGLEAAAGPAVLDEATGDDLTRYYEPKLRRQEPYGVTTGLFTGFMQVETQINWNDAATVLIRQTSPLPMTVAGVYPNVDINE
jgi:hypothetical protein